MSAALETNDRRPEKGQGDYTYLIPFDSRRALRKVHVAESIKGRIIDRTTDADACRKNPSHVLVKTIDDRGPISGVSQKFQHSPEWEYPFSPGYLGRVAIRNGSGVGYIKGVVPVYDRWGGEHHVHIRTRLDMTKVEMRENPQAVRRSCEEAAAEKWHKIRAEMEDEMGDDR